MTTWRHTVLVGADCGACWHESFRPGAPQDRICLTPTPDPASPCGHPECEHDARATWTHPPAGPYLHGPHPYRPTRCTCGHPIEATR